MKKKIIAGLLLILSTLLFVQLFILPMCFLDILEIQKRMRGSDEYGESGAIYRLFMSPEYRLSHTYDDFMKEYSHIVEKKPVFWIIYNKNRVITNGSIIYVNVDGHWFCDGLMNSNN